MTRWTLVNRAGQGRPEAIGEFLQLYRRAMVTHLVLSQKWGPDDAEDVVQSFVVDKICTRNVIAAADRSRGKRFRNFLLTVLDRYGQERRRAAGRLKRRPDHAAELQESFDGAAEAGSVDGFEIQWARDLLAHCIRQMEEECKASGRGPLFEVFRYRVLEPALHGVEPMPYGDMVARYGLADPIQASNLLITAKRMFERRLREGIREYAQTDSDVDEEIQELFHVLSRAR
jgi:DNA-directed RNA polymerase specialized sigma24 family protein